MKGILWRLQNPSFFLKSVKFLRLLDLRHGSLDHHSRPPKKLGGVPPQLSAYTNAHGRSGRTTSYWASMSSKPVKTSDATQIPLTHTLHKPQVTFAEFQAVQDPVHTLHQTQRVPSESFRTATSFRSLESTGQNEQMNTRMSSSEVDSLVDQDRKAKAYGPSYGCFSKHGTVQVGGVLLISLYSHARGP